MYKLSVHEVSDFLYCVDSVEEVKVVGAYDYKAPARIIPEKSVSFYFDSAVTVEQNKQAKITAYYDIFDLQQNPRTTGINIYVDSSVEVAPNDFITDFYF